MFTTGRFLAFLALAALSTSAVARGAIDLSNAVVVSPSPSQPARMLIDEVHKRTGLRWTISSELPPAGRPAISINKAPSPGKPEGYRISTRPHGDASQVDISGNDDRGVLFGVGGLLRAMRLSPGSASLPGSLDIETAPRQPLRGHQLGYRPKTNSYDAWTAAMWEDYIRDLIVFGTNAVELIPPRSDDDADSPHFPAPQMDMMIEMSRILDSYGVDVWIWYPALDEDYSRPETVEFALREWGEVFEKLPRIDAVFVPGGDPGHTDPKYLMALLEKQTANLRKYHPKAHMWVAPQSFGTEWLEQFYSIVDAEPDWLSGIVFGPQVRVGLPELRRRIPEKYPIRRYPDITHSRHSQYPVPEWDVAYAITEGREIINPRPLDQAAIFRAFQDYAIGFLTYSEGCNDDVNKFVWSGLGWDPDKPVIEILREYSRYFLGARYEDDFAQALLALERNWRGSLLTNEGVADTLLQFQTMERAASPATRLNWRFQQALYRAYYDAFVRERLRYETALEDSARKRLRDAPRLGDERGRRDAESRRYATGGGGLAGAGL